MRHLFTLLLVVGCSVSNLAAQSWSPNMLSKLKTLNIDINQLQFANARAVMSLTSDQVEIDLAHSKLYASGKNKINSEYGVISTDKVSLDYVTNEVTFNGNVKLNFKEMSLNSKEAYVKVNEDIFIAKNAVKFEFEPYIGSAEKAVFNRQTNQILFEQNVFFESEHDYAKGDKVIFDLEDETFLSKGRAKIKVSKDSVQ